MGDDCGISVGYEVDEEHDYVKREINEYEKIIPQSRNCFSTSNNLV